MIRVRAEPVPPEHIPRRQVRQSQGAQPALELPRHTRGAPGDVARGVTRGVARGFGRGAGRGGVGGGAEPGAGDARAAPLARAVHHHHAERAHGHLGLGGTHFLRGGGCR